MYEEWKIVRSVPHIMASSMGRVMIKPYIKNGRTYGGHATEGVWSGKRYIYQCRGKTYKVARLVCEAFYGRPKLKKAVCIHIDENAANNLPENLKWGTQKENLNCPNFIAYCRSRRGEDSPRTKWHRKKNA